MAKSVNVGATSIDKKKSAEKAVQFVDEVSKGLHQGERLSLGKYLALKKMAKEIYKGKYITYEDYQMILNKLSYMRKNKKK